jgi:hypothetical protein
MKALEGAHMNKPLPKWAVWKHIPKLKATEAIALTVNVEPSKVRKQTSGKWIVDSTDTGMSVALPEFEERLFLFTRRFGPRVEMSLAELANWSQSVDWNIPIELAALAPWPCIVHDPAPDEAVNAAIASIVAPGADVAELRREIETEGWRFSLVNGSPTVHIPDGTVKGRLEPLANLYSLVGELYYCSKNERIGNLVRGSGASGGGARQANFTSARTQETSSAAALGKTNVAAAGAAVLAVPEVQKKNVPLTSSPDVGESGLSKRERQIAAIVAAAVAEGYAPMSIPVGGKAALKKICKASRSDLFGAGDDPFKEAWQAALDQNRVRTINHNRYTGK